jgi:hypothetical protein
MNGKQPDDTVIDPRSDELRYCLRDVITVNPADMNKFTKLMGLRVLPLFEQDGWSLFNASYAASGDTNTIVHLWHMPKADSLLSAMLAFLENTYYAELQECVVSEEQEILTPTRMCPVIDFKTVKEEANGDRQFLAQTVVVRRDGLDGGQSGAMAAYLRNFAALLPILDQQGWSLIHSSYAITGRPSAIFNLFELRDPADLINVPRWFVGSPYRQEFQELVETIDIEERRLIAPTNYCPLSSVVNLGWKRTTTVTPVNVGRESNPLYRLPKNE